MVGTTGWSLLGNTAINPVLNFLGTTDAQPLIFKTNSIERIRIDNSGNLGIGTSSPASGSLLDVQGVLAISSSGTANTLRFYEPSASGTNFSSFKAQTQTADINYILPNADGTSGYVLSTDGGGNLSWISPTTGSVTGSGAATRLAFWSSASALSSNSNLFWEHGL